MANEVKKAFDAIESGSWLYIGGKVVTLETAIKCHCDKAAVKRDTGDINQWTCRLGNCGFAKYEKKEGKS